MTAHPSTSTASPCVMVIFGAKGDLTKRKLIPALYNLYLDNLLPKQFAIVGFAVNDFNLETFRKSLAEEIPQYLAGQLDPKIWGWFLERIYYVKGDFHDTAAFEQLKKQIAEADQACKTGGNRFFYLAVAPRFFGPIVKQLGAAEAYSGERWELGSGHCGKAFRA